MQTHQSHTLVISKHITALITYLALLPLVYFIPDVISQYLPNIKWLNVWVVVSIIVPIISYIIIPLAHKLLQFMLQRKLKARNQFVSG